MNATAFYSHGGATNLDMVSCCPVETVTLELYSCTLIGDSCDIQVGAISSWSASETLP